MVLGETTISVYALFRLLHSTFFFTGGSLLVTLVHGGQGKAMQESMRLCIRNSEKRKRLKLIFQTPELIKVASFIAEHNVHSYLVFSVNRQLYRKMMTAFILLQLPMNVYTLSQLFLHTGRRPAIELLFLLTIIAIQLICFVLNLCPQALIFTSMNVHPQKIVVPLQARICGGRVVRLKFKLDDLTCRLSCGRPRVAFTVGFGKEITTVAIMEFLSIYFGYLLLIFSQQLKKQF